MMNKYVCRFFCLAACIITLASCATSEESQNLAPVTNGWSSSEASPSYRVQTDDTLYSIAFRFGMDYRKLAELNHLSPPYNLGNGQRLLLSSEETSSALAASPQGVVTGGAPQTSVTSTPVNNVTPAPVSSLTAAASPTETTQPPPAANTAKVSPSQAVPVSADTDKKSGKWLWPAKGKIVQNFSSAYGGNKGVDISGAMGTPVMATSGGKVVYSGSGLKGYGLLIIIKHNSEYLSAYAHNSKAFVKEGDSVKSGQKIALMGSSGASKVFLHFEVRKAGKPIDPLTVLPPQ